MKYILLLIMILILCYLPSQIGCSNNDINFNGQILYSPLNCTNTYLIYRTGEVNHTWLSSYPPGVAVKWLGNGTILRTMRVGEAPDFGGAGGGVQKIIWDGTVVWDFLYNGDNYCSHHDVRVLPNGNVLLIVWEKKTYDEAVGAGRDPENISQLLGFIPDYIVEVKPTGDTTGEIVWEWHVWDHLIQEFNCSKANYGVVKNHPELVDINYQTSAFGDWMHTNSIDYNKEFDQIMLSVRYFNEIWIIDHSTTTEEASGHSGGNSGKGGDLLYRWGNPEAYQRGTNVDQKLFYQHDATWINEGCPGEGNILIYNNGNYRPEGNYTSVDEIIPPVDKYGKYYLKLGEAYGPEMQSWIYTANPPTSFYASYVGGAIRLPDGNTLISNGVTGNIFEVTPEKITVWEYNTSLPLFKAVYIPDGEEPPITNMPDLECSGSLSWTNIDPGATVSGSFQVQNIGDSGSQLNWTINISSINWGTWTFNPEYKDGLTPEDGKMIVQVTVISPNEKNKEFNGDIIVENIDDPDDFDVIPVHLKNPKKINVNFSNYLENNLDIFSIMKLLLLIFIK